MCRNLTRITVYFEQTADFCRLSSKIFKHYFWMTKEFSVSREIVRFWQPKHTLRNTAIYLLLLHMDVRVKMSRRGRMERSISIGPVQPKKSGPPRKVDPLFRNFSVWTEPIHSVLDRNFRKFWLDGSHPWSLIATLLLPFWNRAI